MVGITFMVFITFMDDTDICLWQFESNLNTCLRFLRKLFIVFTNTENRVGNIMRIRVFFKNFEVFLIMFLNSLINCEGGLNTQSLA